MKSLATIVKTILKSPFSSGISSKRNLSVTWLNSFLYFSTDSTFIRPMNEEVCLESCNNAKSKSILFNLSAIAIFDSNELFSPSKIANLFSTSLVSGSIFDKTDSACSIKLSVSMSWTCFLTGISGDIKLPNLALRPKFSVKASPKRSEIPVTFIKREDILPV